MSTILLDDSPDYSIIVPTLNEEGHIAGFIQNIRLVVPGGEIIVSDGGSTDQTIHIVKGSNVLLVQSEKGRGIQCKNGAKLARGKVLIFLHVDSRLPSGALEQLNNTFLNSTKEVANFTIRFQHMDRKYRIQEKLSHLDTIFTRFGDQGIVVKKDFYWNYPFPEQPLFEDVIYFKEVRKWTKLFRLPIELQVSSRRFDSHGFYKTHWINFYLMIGYLVGVSPTKLYRWYYRDKHN